MTKALDDVPCLKDNEDTFQQKISLIQNKNFALCAESGIEYKWRNDNDYDWAQQLAKELLKDP